MNRENDRDATNKSNYVSEKNVSGASLGGRDPTNLTLPELKRWLLCRNASLKGKKADLVVR